ncbi:sulfotransferase [candidate division KSB1 bacterium]|nr:sulfotransferase [candidate division KSB1 bacterium]NIR70036.1 sulfotransferase [candidate division KSB1 bacterium]NIS25891.1 sulfotransferase [candidate division KSB1 bacterium]NIT72767.1 sulfotransferase [candidate division KSB1 bacterium]NIU26579.1 sulfotransferase [candidate division KSB1 bacterium]
MGSVQRTVKLPNFLIVGAARSGTTSLYHYLKQHPHIYMSPVKETHFITAQFLGLPQKGPTERVRNTHIIQDFESYQKLFADVAGEQCIGEASADYLYYYKKAIPTIKKFLGECKIIITLRNPIERAFSSYMYLKRLGYEQLSFEDAIREEPRRLEMGYSYLWRLKSVGLYYKQVAAYLNSFKSVGVFFFDELQSQPAKIVADAYSFLGVDDTFRPKTNVTYNASGTPKNSVLFDFLTRENLFKKSLKPLVDRIFPEERRMHVIEKMKYALLKKTTMLPETRDKLVSFYRNDIERLQELLDKDLSHWLN